MQTPVHTELWYDDDWHDLVDEDRVYTRDPITITRGRARERERVAPSLMNLSIKNNDGKFSIRNPMSELWGKISRNQPVRCWCRLFLDDFGNRTQSGWGFAADGRGWATTGVGTGSFAVGSAVGTHTQTTAAGYRLAFLTGDPKNLWRDCETRVRFSLSGTGMPNIAGGAIEPANLTLRLVDASNYYFLRVTITTAEAVNVSIRKLVANVETALSSVVVVAGLTFSGQALMASFQAEGSVLSGKVWDPTDGEPFDWQVQAVDDSFPDAGVPGVRTGVATGNTNVPVIASYDDYELRVPRVYAEVESWPQRWTVAANEDGTRGDVWAPLKCNGIMRRLGGVGSKAPTFSAQYRSHTIGDQLLGLKAYWPMEAGDGREQQELPGYRADYGGGFFNIDPLVSTPAPGSTRKYGALGGVSPGSPGSASATDLSGGGSPSAAITSMIESSVTRWATEISMRADNDVTGSIFTVYMNAGNLSVHNLTVGFFDTAGGLGIRVSWVLPGGGAGANAHGTVSLVDGAWHHVRLDIRPDSGGANVDYFVEVDDVTIGTGTITGFTYAVPKRVTVSPGGDLSAADHLGFWQGADTNFPIDMPVDATAGYTAFQGFAGEQAHERITRIGEENDIPIVIVGNTSAVLGPQPAGSILDILSDAADADGGILYEPRGFFGLVYITHASLYNRSVAVTLDYAAGGEVAPPLEPTEDTDFVQNDVTVGRVNGGSSRLVQETGPLNVQEPKDDPQGVGRYEVDVQLDLETVDQTLQQAAWIKHLGTWDEPRYPAVTMDLTAMDADDKTALINAAVALDIGDRLVIENPPVWQGPDDVDQHAQGYTETLASHTWRIETTATPDRPWQVGVLDTARLGGTTTISEDLTTTETDITVPSGIFSTTSEPYAVIVGGEVMTVTNATSTVLTVTRSVNGVVKTHTSGDEISIYSPLRLARGA